MHRGPYVDREQRRELGVAGNSHPPHGIGSRAAAVLGVHWNSWMILFFLSCLLFLFLYVHEKDRYLLVISTLDDDVVSYVCDFLGPARCCSCSFSNRNSYLYRCVISYVVCRPSWISGVLCVGFHCVSSSILCLLDSFSYFVRSLLFFWLASVIKLHSLLEPVSRNIRCLTENFVKEFLTCTG